MGDRGVGQMSEVWEARAGEWSAWARTPGHDIYFWRLNWPAFCELLPVPGEATLDLGCGEGGVGAETARDAPDRRRRRGPRRTRARACRPPRVRDRCLAHSEQARARSRRLRAG